MCHGVCNFTHDSFQLALYRHKKKPFSQNKRWMDQGVWTMELRNRTISSCSQFRSKLEVRSSFCSTNISYLK